MALTQKAVLLPCRSSDPTAAQQVEIPSIVNLRDPNASLQSLYAPLFAQGLNVSLQPVAFDDQLGKDNGIGLLCASDPRIELDDPKLDPVNPLAAELALTQLRTGRQATVRGDTYVLHRSGCDFLLQPHWEALYETCYGLRLSQIGKKRTEALSLEEQEVENKSLAEQYRTRLRQVSQSAKANADVKMEQPGDEEEDGWTDEEVEKPREPKKHVEDSDDERMDADEAAEEEEEEEDEGDEDSEGSYEDEESELESDEDDNDPRKKALLDMIKAAITKDGKLDMERLGLVEKNGKLVPKDD